MSKNMTWREISYLNIKKLDLFKSFSEFLNVYERYDNQLVCNLITYAIIFYTVYLVIPIYANFVLFIFKEQNFPF